MFRNITKAARRTYRRHRPRQQLGRVLATSNQPKPLPAPLLPPPVLERTEQAWAAIDAFQHAYLDPWIDRAMFASFTFARVNLLPLLPAKVRTMQLEHLPLIGDTRKQYAHILFGEDLDDEPTREEQAFQRQLTVAFATLGFNGIAAVVAPHMMLLSIPCLLYLVKWFFRGSYLELVYERRFGFKSFITTGIVGTFLLGQLWAEPIWSILLVPAEMFIIKTRLGGTIACACGAGRQFYRGSPNWCNTRTDCQLSVSQ